MFLMTENSNSNMVETVPFRRTLQAKGANAQFKRYPKNLCVFVEYRDMCVKTYRTPLVFSKLHCALYRVQTVHSDANTYLMTRNSNSRD